MHHKSSSPIVICFYTLDTPYEQEVLRLAASCERWGVEHHIEAITSKGSWEANCNLKPGFILKKLEEFDRPVFWVDADAAFLKAPDFTPFLSWDISVREMALFAGDPRYHFNSASFFVNNTPAALKFLRAWKAVCETDSSAPFQDQRALYTLLQDRLYPNQIKIRNFARRRLELEAATPAPKQLNLSKPKRCRRAQIQSLSDAAKNESSFDLGISLRFLPMPIAYCKVYDLDQFFLDDAHVVIEQAQASRTHKPFFTTPS